VTSQATSAVTKRDRDHVTSSVANTSKVQADDGSWCHGVGRDINVQCVLIKEMIIIVDHYTLAVRNRR
jgi:hypothetical protein